MKNILVIKKYKKLLVILLIMFACSYMLYLLNIRITPMAALKANEFIGQDIEIVEEVELNWGKVYIVDTEEAFQTALVEKHGLFWKSSVSFTCKKKPIAQDKLKTIGYMNYTNKKQKQIQILAIQNQDPKVTSIHITREDGETFTQLAPLNKLILFKWDELSNVNTMNILGLNKEGKVLYQYGYPKGANILRDSEYKWHAITE